MKTKVFLYGLCDPALIVPSDTGVTYHNQTGGHACLPSSLEGYLVPLGENRILSQKLLRHFTGAKWGGWCMDRIDEETASFIDDLLADISREEDIVVNREKLESSREAWVYVKLSPPFAFSY
jgi:hypothetical protein